MNAENTAELMQASDIGANVGMYSMLAGKSCGLRVFSFEPESQNYALLNRNIHLNRLSETVTAFPIALSDANKVDRLYLSEFTTGGSCHQFGAQTNFNLQPVRSPFAQGCVAFSLDSLVAQGFLPQPHHIKIDVDGLEHLVMSGAVSVIRDPQMKSLLVEINGGLAQHRELIDLMTSLGFIHDARQVESSVRTEGTFKGCGNYIFWRESEDFSLDFSSIFTQKERNVLEYMKSKITDAPLEMLPSPHFVVDALFPPDFYKEIIKNRVDNDAFVSIGTTGRTTGAYKDRYMLKLDGESLAGLDDARRTFWGSLGRILNSTELLHAFTMRYYEIIEKSGILAADSIVVNAENLLIRDKTNYAIGPHTDAPHRLFSVMIYLPKDESLSALGTSLYVPKDPAFRCDGGPHYPFDNFERVKTARFSPNSAFCFLKTDNSFHGVEPILEQEVERDAICYIARIKGSGSAVVRL